MGEQVVTLREAVALQEAAIRLAREMKVDDLLWQIVDDAGSKRRGHIEVVLHGQPEVTIRSWFRGRRLEVWSDNAQVYAARDIDTGQDVFRSMTMFRMGAWLDVVRAEVLEIEAKRQTEEDLFAGQKVEKLVAAFGPLEEE